MRPTSKTGYSDWLTAHRNHPDAFEQKLEAYLTKPSSWAELARYEFRCIDKSHSHNVWSTLLPLYNERIWESFRAWLVINVFNDPSNTLAPYLSERILAAHNKLGITKLVDIGKLGLAAGMRDQKWHLASNDRKCTIDWIPLLAEAAVSCPEESNARLSLVADTVSVVPRRALDGVLTHPLYWADEATDAELVAHMAPEAAELCALYEGLGLSLQEIGNSLKHHLNCTNNAPTVSDGLTLPDF